MKIEQYQETKKVALLGIGGNLFLWMMKMVIAFISKSQAMFADSMNSITDVFSSVMTLIGGRIANEPSDEGHNYGHGKAEYIFSFMISMVMILLAIQVVASGVENLLAGNTFLFSTALVVVCLLTIVIKFGMYWYTHRIYRKTENILIRANAEDHLNDVYTTASVLVGIIAGYCQIYWLDSVVAFIIAIRIIVVAVQIFLDSYRVLMDPSIAPEKMEKMIEIMKQFREIDHIDKVTSKAVGKQFLIIAKVSVDGNMTVKKSHEIAGKVKAKMLKDKDIYDVIVHINPVE